MPTTDSTLVDLLVALMHVMPDAAADIHLTAQVHLLVSSVWHQLRIEAHRLLGLWRTLPQLGGALQGFVFELHATLTWLLASSLYPPGKLSCAEGKSRTVQMTQLRVGLISPGTLGCMHLNNQDANWKPILDTQTGVVKAMTALGLSVVGLPGARIPAGSRIPGRDDLRIYARARGGPSHASCALMWSGVDLQPQTHLGSDRRIIAKLPTLQGDKWLILVYLPPDNGVARDDE